MREIAQYDDKVYRQLIRHNEMRVKIAKILCIPKRFLPEIL